MAVVGLGGACYGLCQWVQSGILKGTKMGLFQNRGSPTKGSFTFESSLPKCGWYLHYVFSFFFLRGSFIGGLKALFFGRGGPRIRTTPNY